MSLDQTHLFFASALGFALAGFLATGFQLATCRPLSFRLLELGPKPSTFAVVPFLVFSAPFLIMRSTLVGPRTEGTSFQFVMISTVVAGLWSLMSGTVAMSVLAAFVHG